MLPQLLSADGLFACQTLTLFFIVYIKDKIDLKNNIYNCSNFPHFRCLDGTKPRFYLSIRFNERFIGSGEH